MRASYAALGLLPNIPLPSQSGSRSHRAKLQVGEEGGVKGAYGRIVRDDEGNVVDIIIGGDEEASHDSDEEMEEESVGKTDVVRCTFPGLSLNRDGCS